MGSVGRPGSLIGQSKEYPTPENETSDGLTLIRCFFVCITKKDSIT